MTIIRFPNEKEESSALGFLAGRVSFRSFDTGETYVPASALALLANKGFTFTVVGVTDYENITKVRGVVADAV